MTKPLNYLGFFFAGIYFLIGVLTLSHYGLNFDEPIHFIRGQAYLNLLTTGRTTYVPEELYNKRVSEWKIGRYDAEYFLQNDKGHPPLNGILAAAFNRVFFEWTGLLPDLESYHLFETFVSSLLVLLVYRIAAREWGIFAGLAAVLSLSLYPLFWGESHFNIKDPVETTFFAYALYYFYFGIRENHARWFLYSAGAAAFAFGTKFNIIFAPFIILPYLVIRYGRDAYRLGVRVLRRIPAAIYLSLVLYPVIVFGIHVLTRPYLWQNTVTRFLEIVTYYEGIGSGNSFQPDYLFYGWNTYPLIFVLISTPIVVLSFTLIGVVTGVMKYRNSKHSIFSFLIFWLIVPILRVMWPNASIYSGVRQIMEFIPAMAVISGLGALAVRNFIRVYLKSLPLASIVTVLFFLPLFLTLLKLHPNENVYMNRLAGGLTGAVARRIPGAGETMGNVYLQGIQWLNDNAETNAYFGLPVGHHSNIPQQKIRSDIRLYPSFSGIKQSGEYMMEAFSVDFPIPKYAVLYLDRFLEPVYEVRVDNVSLLKIWKNDSAHIRPDMRTIKELAVSVSDGDFGVSMVQLVQPSNITRLEVDSGADPACMAKGSGQVYVSDFESRSASYRQLDDDSFLLEGPIGNAGLHHYTYTFPGILTRGIKFVPGDSDTCYLNLSSVRLWGTP